MFANFSKKKKLGYYHDTSTSREFITSIVSSDDIKVQNMERVRNIQNVRLFSKNAKTISIKVDRFKVRRLPGEPENSQHQTYLLVIPGCIGKRVLSGNLALNI